MINPKRFIIWAYSLALFTLFAPIYMPMITVEAKLRLNGIDIKG